MSVHVKTIQSAIKRMTRMQATLRVTDNRII
jgi:hypothetical protein